MALWLAGIECVGSVDVFRVGVGLLEAGLAALEHLLPQRGAVLGLAGVALEAADEGIVLGRTLLLDDQHARRSHVLAREPRCRGKYSMPLFSSSVLRFLAVENM